MKSRMRQILCVFLLGFLPWGIAESQQLAAPEPADSAKSSSIAEQAGTVVDSTAAGRPDASTVAGPGSALVAGDAGQPASGATGSQAEGEKGRTTARKALTERASRLGDMFSPYNIVAALVVLLAAYIAIRVFTLAVDLLAARFGQHRLKLMKLVPVVRITTWVLAIELKTSALWML